MIDQAADLRELARRSTLEQAWASPVAPRRLIVSGGKGGVGTTTVAVNLAVAMAAQGHRTVLVDANLNQGGVARLCPLQSRDTIAAVLAARRNVHEVLQNGPCGLQILPGLGAFDQPPDASPSAQERLIHQLLGLGQFADVMVLDAGSGLTHVVRRFWRMADLVLLVTTPEPDAIMDAYAAIKVLPEPGAQLRLRTLINLATDEAAARVHERLQTVSDRFLGRRVAAAGSIPTEPAVRDAARLGQPFVLTAPGSAASEQLTKLAERLMATAELAAA